MSNGPRTKAHASVAGTKPSVAAGRATRRPRRFLLPFRSVQPAVFFADAMLVMAVSIVTGVGYHWLFLGSLGRIEVFLSTGVLVFANFSAVLAARGNYRITNLVNFRRQVSEVTVAWVGVCLLLLSVAFSLKATQNISRGAAMTFFVAGYLGIVAWRGLLAHYLADALAKGAFAERKAILLGEHDLLASSHALNELRRCGYKAVKSFEIRTSEIDELGIPSSLQATLAAVIDTTRTEEIEDIFLLIDWDHGRCIDDVLSVLRVLPIPIHLVPDENVARFLSHPMIHVGRTWTAELKRAPLTAIEQACKRALDVVLAGAALLLLFPLMLVTALLIKLDSRGSIFFTQARNGFNGRSFRIFKFRTMRVLEDGAEIRQATVDDPRVTRLGRWLRRTNIDELPQLFNVMRAEMSLVGPRPHAAAHNTEYEQLISNYAFRYHVKPGITGWAQVNGFRGETRTVEIMAQRIELDLWYINNWSIWLDARILLRTLLLGLQPSAY